MGLRLSTGIGPVRFSSKIPVAVVGVGVLGLLCCGAVGAVFDGDDKKTSSSSVPDDAKYGVASPFTPEPAVGVTTSTPRPVVRATTARPSPKPTPRKTTARPKPVRTTKAPSTDHQYGTCKEAIAHGLGPYYKGKDPEYYWYRDPDHDGVTCERD